KFKIGKKIAKVYYSASKKTKKLLKDTSKALFAIAKKANRRCIMCNK
ncbi:unnamed protein product, partial [marine sediment metagenome]